MSFCTYTHFIHESSNEFILNIFPFTKSIILPDIIKKKSAQNTIKTIRIPYTQRAPNSRGIMGSANCSERDLNKFLNRPASGKLRQSTAVSSQCEQLS